MIFLRLKMKSAGNVYVTWPKSPKKLFWIFKSVSIPKKNIFENLEYSETHFRPILFLVVEKASNVGQVGQITLAEKMGSRPFSANPAFAQQNIPNGRNFEPVCTTCIIGSAVIGNSDILAQIDHFLKEIPI